MTPEQREASSERAKKSHRVPETHSCVCAFAMSVEETDPYKFPRVGLQTNVLYRCRLIIRHEGTGVHAIQPPTKECCPAWFNQSAGRTALEEAQ